MPDVSSQGLRVYYEVEGNGPSLVLYHGLTGSGQRWRDTGHSDGSQVADLPHIDAPVMFLVPEWGNPELCLPCRLAAVNPDERDSSAAASHSAGSVIQLLIIAATHEVQNDAIISTQTKLGSGASTPASGKFLKGTGAGTPAWG